MGHGGCGGHSGGVNFIEVGLISVQPGQALVQAGQTFSASFTDCRQESKLKR